MAITLLILSIIAAWFSWQLVKLLRNYIIVRTLGLPILFTPFGLVNPVWKIGESYLAPLLRRLPFGLANFVEYSSVSCLFTDRYMRHAQLGPAYVVVSPAENVIIIADAAAAMDVLLRRTDFDKPEGVYKPLELFGPNVDTVNGGDWQRHRRLTTPPFSERNSKLVWKESLVQANDMLRTWMSKGRAGIGGVEQDAMTLALHVIASAGFGKSYPFSGGVQYPAEGHSLSYREALNLVLTNVFLTIIIASVSLPSILLPRKVAEVKQGLIEFKQYMVEMVEEERRSSRHHGSEKDNLMSILIRAAASDGDDKGRKGFTDNEIFGNLFIFNLAGHHTTANTIVYALVMLSAHPQWQDWVYEELTTVFEGKEKVEDWDYNSAFPQLKRCLAVMFETLRFIGVSPFIPKYTHELPQTLTIKGKDYVIPPCTYVNLQLPALHSLPEYWGSDSLVWRPDRWILSNDGVRGLEHERLLQPTAGTFLPWAGGPRVCPGKKFAQVEFVAVIGLLFWKNRVRPALEPGETFEESSKRLLALVEDSSWNVSMTMRHPERLKLVWEERDLK